MMHQQAAAKPRAGAELEAFGKQAAGRYLSGESKNLNDAIVSTVKTAGLSPEQVRRVVEFANTEAYLKEFNKEGASHKVVNFVGGPASPSEVLKDLNDGGGGTVFDRGDGDYSMPPPNMYKAASTNADRFGFEDPMLKQAFAVEEDRLPFASPMEDAMDAKDKLASLHNEVQAELTVEESRYFDICDVLFSTTKQAALEGMSLGHIVAAWGSVTEDATFIKAAFQVLSPRLLENEVFSSKEAMADSLTKTAGVTSIVNVEHPIMKVYVDFRDCLVKMAALRQVGEDAAQQVDNLVVFLNEMAKQAGAVETLAKGISKVPKAWSRATEATAKASGPARRAAETLGGALSPEIGSVAGKVVGTGVKYAPHIAAGLAAEEVYQHARYSPAVQGAKNMVLSRVPYTHPYLVRQYDLQQRML